MNYVKASYEELKQIGILLYNPYQIRYKGLLYPILIGKIVYKFFHSGIDSEKERILLELAKMNLKYLSKLNSFLISDVEICGYSYFYDNSPLLKEVLNRPLSLNI